jgi:hypothetical protein
MQTIFHKNRKKMPATTYVRVFTYQPPWRDGIVRYTPHEDRETRERWERFHAHRDRPLYRVNVYRRVKERTQ